MAIARLADVGAVDLLATVIDGDQHAPRWQKKTRSGCSGSRCGWPTGRRPALARDTSWTSWPRSDRARAYHKSLVSGAGQSYEPAFGAMAPEQLAEMDSGTGLVPAAGRARSGGPLGDGPPDDRPGADHGHGRLVPPRLLQAVYPRGPGAGPGPRRPRLGLHRQRPTLTRERATAVGLQAGPAPPNDPAGSRPRTSLPLRPRAERGHGRWRLVRCHPLSPGTAAP